jgi:hypothetical protein
MKNKKNFQLHHNKYGQMQISFGVIFSIILIVVFVAFAIYGIGKILCMNKIAQVGTFKSDFQADIDRIHRSTYGSEEVGPYYLPKGIEQVCFVRERKNQKTGKMENMYFVSDESRCDIPTSFLINNVDMYKTTANSPGKTLCIENTGGKISMIIKKESGENLLIIMEN